MRSNIVTEAGLPTRMSQYWEGIPFLTSSIVIVCATIYLICLFVGYDSFTEICFLPSAVVSNFQVYRIYTSVLFHGSLLHVLFNMLALVPLGSELERIMGSVRLLYVIVLLATSNALFHLFIALVVAHNPIRHLPYLMNECAIGFSGILFSMIVIETSLSGAQTRSVFGLFNVPAKWYAWILLIVFQLLMSNVSLLGHLCGILSGFAYTYGLFNYVLPGASFYSSIENSSLLAACVRRPKFILCTGSSPSGYIPTHSNSSATSSALFSRNTWRNISSWMPQRETSQTYSSFIATSTHMPNTTRSTYVPNTYKSFTGSHLIELYGNLNQEPFGFYSLIPDEATSFSKGTGGVTCVYQMRPLGNLENNMAHMRRTQIDFTNLTQAQQDDRFPGRARTLSSGQNQAYALNSDSSLQARLLDTNSPDHFLEPTVTGGHQTSDGRHSAVDNAAAVAGTLADQQEVIFSQEIEKLVAMGFERMQVEVALAAADGDSSVAVEILMTQQV